MFDLLAAAVIAVSEPRQAPVAPDVVCQFEDGNSDGSACVWTDPGTGSQYHVDSANYR